MSHPDHSCLPSWKRPLLSLLLCLYGLHAINPHDHEWLMLLYYVCLAGVVCSGGQLLFTIRPVLYNWLLQRQSRRISTNFLLYSPAGGGKTVCYFIPNLLHLRMSIAVADLKGTIYEVTARIRETIFKQIVLYLDPAGIVSGQYGMKASMFYYDDADFFPCFHGYTIPFNT